MTQLASSAATTGTVVPPDSRPTRRPLYARGFHLLTRTGHAFMAAIYVALVIGLIVTLPSQRGGLPMLVWPLMLVLFPLAMAPYLRASALYGTPQGLEIVRFGKRRTVPWQNVGHAEFLGWSLTYPARVAEVTIYGESESSIRFFATKDNLAELAEMRSKYAKGT